MKKIIIAGAGHGGLVAAKYLAEAGFDVTVYEAKAEEALGYDQYDSVHLDGFELAGVPVPEAYKVPRTGITFMLPGTDLEPLKQGVSEGTYNVEIDRKALYRHLIAPAKEAGVKFEFSCRVNGPVVLGSRVVGLDTAAGVVYADLVIDAAGVFSPLRTKLPKYLHIENEPKENDLFYAYRAYYKKTENISPEAPFEIYLRHNGEKGLSWFYTADDYVDILIGRTAPLTEEQIEETVSVFRLEHPWFDEKIVHGGERCVIPVRRPLTLMVANGYAAVGDSAFMTTPMNGMGIDLSLQAGMLLADTVLHAPSDHYTADVLWEYNRDYHLLYGGETAKNEGLKNALLSLPAQGVDFLFEQDVIQATDLSGAGRNMNVPALLGKFTRGMHKPPFFFTIINGLIKGSKAAALYQSPPPTYDLQAIIKWDKAIRACDV